MESSEPHLDLAQEASNSPPKPKALPKTYIFRDEVDKGNGGLAKSRIWLQEPTEETLKYMKSKLPLQRKGNKDKTDISLDELKEILRNKGDSEISLDKVATLLKSMGLVDIPPEDYPILLEVLDKNKDGKICFKDFISQIPTFDCDKVFGDQKTASPVMRKNSIQQKGLGKRKLHLPTSMETSEAKQDSRFKYDKTTASQHSVIILSEEDYAKIIEDYKEKMSM